MSENKDNKQELSKVEEARQKRKQRLEEITAKDGSKKPIVEKKSLWLRLVAILIVLGIIAGLGIWLAASYGLPQRYLTAAVVNGQEMKAAELNFYAGGIGQRIYPEGVFNPQYKAELDKKSQYNPEMTNREFILDLARKNAEVDTYIAKLAEADKVELNEEDNKIIDTYFTQINNLAAEKKMTEANLLKNLYGAGINKEIITKVLKRSIKRGKYQEDKINKMSFDDQKLEEAYAKDQDKYDVVSFLFYNVPLDVKEGATEDEKKEAQEKVKKEAGKVVPLIKDKASFKEQILNFVPEDKKADFDNEDNYTVRNANKAQVQADTSNWLFEEGRKEGDTNIIDSKTGISIVYFLERKRPEDKSFTSRHILIKADEKGKEEDLEKAKKKAEEILAEYQKGEKTEDSFAKLAQKHSEDGNKEEGGLYKDTKPGSFVKEYENYCLDPQRKAGDVEIVKTRFGYHIIYFVSLGEEAWKTSVSDLLKQEEMTKWMEEIRGKVSFEEKFGMRYVLP